MTWWIAHWTEVVGFVTGLVCVLLAARRIIWNYPIGIANNVVFGVLFVEHALYADAGLQVLNVVLGVTGWLGWARRPAVDQRVAVTHVPRRWVLWLAAVALAGTALLTVILGRYTDSTTQLADAGTTTVSLVAQVMMNRRWIESWYVWIAVDVAYIGLYAAKGLFITGALYLIFIALCVLGYRTWRQAPAAQPDDDRAPRLPEGVRP